MVAAPPQAADIKQVLQCFLKSSQLRLLRLCRNKATYQAQSLNGRMQILETLIEGRDLTEQQTQDAMEVCPLNHPFALNTL